MKLGQALAAAGSMTPPADFEAEAYVLKEEGSPIKGDYSG